MSIRKLAAILVTDIVGFSRLAGLDEERTLARLRALRGDLVDPAVAAHHGRIVKGTGDGSIVEFRSVIDAMRCAIEVQNGLVERNAGVPPERRIEFRVGIHVGEVVEESDGDLMGDAVNIAVRLEGIAKPRAICLSEDAYRQVKGRLGMEVRDLGAVRLKNIAEPMRAYLVEVGPPAELLKPRSATHHRLAGSLAMLALLVVAGAAGWEFIAGKPLTSASSSTTPTTSSFGTTAAIMPAMGNLPIAPSAGAVGWDSMAGGSPTSASSSTTPMTSSFGPTAAITPTTRDQPPRPSHAETQPQGKPTLISQRGAHPIGRKVVRSSAKSLPSSPEPTQFPFVESASNSSQPCVIPAAQTNGTHSCGYLRGQPSNSEEEPSSVESAMGSSRPCAISAAQINGNHVTCAYLRGY
jgi:class 3 adenylate cyclase